MVDSAVLTRPLAALRSRGLKGRLQVPSDPFITSFALMLAALARGETVIYADTAAPGPDIAATLRLLSAVGAPATVHDDRWVVHGLGPLGLLSPEAPLGWAGAPKSLPLAMGLLGPYGFTSQFEGEGAGVPRALLDALRSVGVEARERRTGTLPVTLRGPKTPVPFWLQLPAGAEGVEPALLLSALALPGVSTVTTGGEGVDHGRRLLRHFGAELLVRREGTGTEVDITGIAPLGARTLTLAGDPEIAALAIIAALIVPDSEILVENVLMHPARRGTIDVLMNMGATIDVVDRRQAAGEECADLKVSHSALLGLDIDRAMLLPEGIAPLAVAGAFAAGETRLPSLGFPGETEFRERLISGLSANGATVRLEGGDLVVGRPTGGRKLGGKNLDAGGDPMLAAAILVFGLAAAEPVTINGPTPLDTALPALIGALEGLGAEFYRRWTR